MSSFIKEKDNNIHFRLELSFFGWFTLAVQVMIVINIAFYNITNLMIASQMVPLGFLVACIFRSDKLEKAFYRYLWWWLVFAMLCMLSVTWGKNPESFVQQMISVLQCAVVGCATMVLAIDRERQEKLLDAVLLGGLILSIRLLVQVPLSAWGTERVGNYISYGNNSAGIDLSFCSVFAAYRYFARNRKRYLLLALLFLVITIFTGSKKSLLAVVAGMIVLLIFARSQPRVIGRNIFLAALAVIVLYFSIMRIPVLYEAIGSRFEALFTMMGEEEAWKYSESSSASRLYLINEAWSTFLQSPVLGVGLNGFSLLNRLGAYTHTNYLELLCSLGIVGFVAYYWLWLTNLYGAFGGIGYASDEERKRISIKLAILIYMLVMDIGLVSFANESTHIAIALALGIGHVELPESPRDRGAVGKYIRA